MLRGAYFYRVARRFGGLGKIINFVAKRKVFLWISDDFANLFYCLNEPNRSISGKKIFVKIREKDLGVCKLQQVTGLDYGDTSRSFRLQEHREWRIAPHLCLSIDVSNPGHGLDLVALNERDAETWVLGLNSLIPFYPQRVFYTSEEFAMKKAALKAQYDWHDQTDAETVDSPTSVDQDSPVFSPDDHSRGVPLILRTPPPNTDSSYSERPPAPPQAADPYNFYLMGESPFKTDLPLSSMTTVALTEISTPK